MIVRSLLFISFLTLSACGGGGSTTVPKQSGPFTLVLERASLTLDENTSVDVNVTTTNADAVSFSVVSSDADVSATYSAGKLKVVAAELDKNKSVTVKLSGVRGSNSADVSLSVNLTNTSVNQLLADAKPYIDHAVALPLFSKEAA